MADFDPLESTRPFMAAPPADTFADDLLQSGVSGSEGSTGLREGLPPGYRMRHDAHYVDQLTSRSAETVVRPVRGRSASMVTLELSQTLSTVQSCLGLLPAQGRPLRERLALELARAELQRASWLLGAQGVLSGEPSIMRRDLRAAPLVERVVAGLDPERRLSAVQLQVEIADASLIVRADEKLLTVAVAGMLDATLALVRRVEESRVVVRLIGRAAPASMVLDISQDAITLPTVAHFLDPEWVDRPGGMTAGIGLAAAQRVAELHGGRLTVAAGDRAGSHLTLVIPSMS